MLNRGALTLSLLLGSLACGVPEPPTDRSTLARLTPAVNPAELKAAVAGNTDFALELHRRLSATDQNAISSGYSVSTALGMLWAGARGTSETALATALRFPFPQAAQHPLFNHLDREMLARNDTVGDYDRFQLRVVNDLWAQVGWAPLPAFLDVLGTQYGAGLRRLDFATKPEQARTTINDWIASQTHDRIRDLFPEGSIDASTVLALTNAVYFKADWSEAFDPKNTANGTFHRLNGTTLDAPFMHRRGKLPLLVEDGLTAVELPYAGEELAMLALMPSDLPAFERDLSAAKLESIAGRLAERDVELSMPKWTFEQKADLEPVLTALGAGALFTSDADLSGIDGHPGLFVQAVIHQAFVLVEESGTEAAAATGVSVGRVSIPEPGTPVALDRPFVYLLRDRKTGSLLFIGRVAEPHQG